MNKLLYTYKIPDIGLGRYIPAEIWYPFPPIHTTDRPLSIIIGRTRALGYLYYE